jgi:hypothetical protein
MRFDRVAHLLILCGTLMFALLPAWLRADVPVERAGPPAIARPSLDVFLKAPDGVARLEGEIIAARLAIKTGEFEIEDIRDTAGGQRVFNTHHWLAAGRVLSTGSRQRQKFEHGDQRW